MRVPATAPVQPQNRPQPPPRDTPPHRRRPAVLAHAAHQHWACPRAPWAVAVLQQCTSSCRASCAGTSSCDTQEVRGVCASMCLATPLCPGARSGAARSSACFTHTRARALLVRRSCTCTCWRYGAVHVGGGRALGQGQHVAVRQFVLAANMRVPCGCIHHVMCTVEQLYHFLS